MSSSNPTRPVHRIDRLIDTLIDRKHPFWKDERQAAIYNEAASAALVLQTFLLVIIGAIGLLIAGKPAIGIVTAMVLTATLGQMLIFWVLLRRHVEIDMKAWSKQASLKRKAIGVCTYLFYVGAFTWAKFRGTTIGNVDLSTIAGLITGSVTAIALFTLVGRASKRAIKQRQAQNGGDE
jgi:plasmid maintenance system antidote protein VapI